jgi:UDP-N-acetyl-D-mannosaminuronic acid transferase (WecB/TagA/CpsF family)
MPALPFMSEFPHPAPDEHCYRRILGVRFFVGDAPRAVDIGVRGGLVVVPSAPSLLELRRDDRQYRQALLEADLAVADSGFMVLFWNLIMRDRIQRVSGLEYIQLLLLRPEFREPGATFWVMPSVESMARNMAWLRANQFPVQPDDCYVAPRYAAGTISDDELVKLVNSRRPRHVVIGLGGGIQEKLGLYLRQNCASRPAIHCTGAAIAFLTGDQAPIPRWADRLFLGWFMRCVSNPRRFVPRYVRASQLALVLWRYGSRTPAPMPT